MSPFPMSNCTSAPPSPFGSGFVAFSGATIVTPRRLSCDNWLNVLRASSNALRHGLFSVGATKMVSCLGLRFLTLSSQGVGILISSYAKRRWRRLAPRFRRLDPAMSTTPQSCADRQVAVVGGEPRRQRPLRVPGVREGRSLAYPRPSLAAGYGDTSNTPGSVNEGPRNCDRKNTERCRRSCRPRYAQMSWRDGFRFVSRSQMLARNTKRQS